MNIAIITGATSGLGKEFALQLCEKLNHTDEIWLLARRKDLLDEFAASLTSKVKTIGIDITDEAQVSRLAETLMILNAGITVLVNCAGTGTYGAFDKQSRDEVTETVRLNVLALTQLTKICLPYMRKGSKIIQVASGAAFLPQKNFAVYAASKAYVYSFGKALAKELKKEKIRVTIVCPGPVKTPFIEHAYGRYGQMSCLKKLTMAKPEKVVKKALTDCRKKKTLSLYGLPMQLLYALTRGVIRW